MTNYWRNVQATRLGLGHSKYSMTWAANSIILQTRIGAVVVSVILDEGANLGLIDENMSELSNILKPLCVKSWNSDVSGAVLHYPFALDSSQQFCWYNFYVSITVHMSSTLQLVYYVNPMFSCGQWMRSTTLSIPTIQEFGYWNYCRTVCVFVSPSTRGDWCYLIL
jgi:hypothetical protein